MLRRVRTWLAAQRGAVRVAAAVAAAAAVGFAGFQVYALFATDSRVARAKDALNKRDYKTARELLAQGLAARPDSAELTFLAARAARRTGDMQALRDADKLLKRAEELGWVENAIKFERALLDAQGGRFRANEPALAAYVQADPPNPDADLVLEVLVPGYMQEFELGKALDLLGPWIAREPKDVRLRLWQTEAARRISSRALAREALEGAYAAEPENEEVRFKLGELLNELHRSADARPHWDWLLAKAPGRADYRLGAARCDREIGDTDAAVRKLDALLKEDPQNPKVLAARGYADLFAARPAEALPFLRKAAENDPFNAEVLTNLALAADQTGHPDEAKAARDRAATTEADVKQLEDVTKLILSRPEDAELRFRAGAIMIRNGQQLEGRRWLESALRVDPNYEPARVELEKLLFRRYGPKPRP